MDAQREKERSLQQAEELQSQFGQLKVLQQTMNVKPAFCLFLLLSHPESSYRCMLTLKNTVSSIEWRVRLTFNDVIWMKLQCSLILIEQHKEVEACNLLVKQLKTLVGVLVSKRIARLRWRLWLGDAFCWFTDWHYTAGPNNVCSTFILSRGICIMGPQFYDLF